MPHTYTKEIILNYTCTGCKNWWSYATQSFIPLKMACPHCGLVDATQEQDPIQVITNSVPFQNNPSIKKAILRAD